MPHSSSNKNGFALIELIVIVVLIGLMTAVAVPSYDRYIERARVTRAIGDVSSIDVEIERFRLNNEDRIPDSLGELNFAIPEADPWGRPYQFLNIRMAPNLGAVRKDGKLNPINTDYDLYSVGADGGTAKPLRAKAARDDIVRANNGAYIGLAENY